MILKRAARHLLLLGVALSPGAAGANVLHCPPAGESTVIVVADGGADNVSLTIAPSDGPGKLCTLTMRGDDGVPVPVARSYDGRDWEVSAGPHMNVIPPFAPCADGGGSSSCVLAGLPVPPDGVDYVLRSHHPRPRSDSPTHMAVRFLEQSTFGQTRETVDELLGLSSGGQGQGDDGVDYAGWVRGQIDTPGTYHREVWRRNAPTHEYPFHFGAPGPDTACHAGGHWRKYALSTRDGLHDWKTSIEKFFRVYERNGKYVWTVEDQARTVTDVRPTLYEDRKFTNLIEDVKLGTYHGISENNPTYDCVDCPVHICRYTSEGSVCGWVKNPPVTIEGIEDIVGLTVVDLPPILEEGPGAAMVSIDNGPGEEFQDAHFVGEYRRPNDKFWLKDNAAVDPNDCASHPNVADAAYHNRNAIGNQSGHKSVEYSFPPIFGRVTNAQTGATEYVLFDPQLHWLGNTIEDPLPDGGGYAAHLSGDMVYEKGLMHMLCSNMPRNPFNEKHCKLSTSEYACTSINGDRRNGQLKGTIKSGPGVVVCGGEGEVAVDPSLGTEGSYRVNYDGGGASNKVVNYENHRTNAIKYEKYALWGHTALTGKDQLRQRVAWALYQILPINGNVGINWNEGVLTYYDIFTRNAFGSYLDILRGVTFHPIMANWLTFANNKALQYQLDQNSMWILPDENYAREIMQLFTVGLVQLNMDGTTKLDGDGNPIDVYDQEDIMSMARAFTGFVTQHWHYSNQRANGESTMDQDPLYIHQPVGQDIQQAQSQKSQRDVHPKSDLYGGYIGDGVGLCSDLPDRDHLRKGAIYRLLGSRNTPELMQDYHSWEETQNPTYDGKNRLKLELSETSSPLYNILCAPDQTGACTYPGYVELNANLDYSTSSAQAGMEYEVDTVRVIKVHSSDGSAWYYEFSRVPCVGFEYLLPGTAKKVFTGTVATSRTFTGGRMASSMCAEKSRAIARESCCEPGTNDLFREYTSCKYYSERVKYETAVDRCAAIGKEMCQPTNVRSSIDVCQIYQDRSHNAYHDWTTAECQTKAKISLETGLVAVVHDTEPDHSGTTNIPFGLNATNPNEIKVSWKSDEQVGLTLGVPKFGGVATEAERQSSCAAILACDVSPDSKACICDVTIVESPVFSSASLVGSKENLLANVKVGSFPLDMFDDEQFVLLGNCGVEGVEMYARESGATCTSLDTNVVFVLPDRNNIVRYYRNVESVVSIDNTELAFRNPVNLNSYLDKDRRDMYYEVEAVLQHLFHHPSHPPFLAVRMIQRFGVSNPSPSYIERVATAYKEGMYSCGIYTFGNGHYGSLEALVAAVLLDVESRSPSLDSDPSHGHLREPILKMTTYMRSLGGFFITQGNQPRLRAPGITNLIGQGPYEAPSVFSFFGPDYQPGGWATAAGIVAPEAQVLTGKRVTTMIDSMWTLSKFGLTSCHNGVGNSLETGDCPTRDGDFSKSDGWLRYTAPEDATVDELIDDLSLWLTSGRLTAVSHDLIKGVIEGMYQEGSDTADREKAVRIAQQLIASTPEYHTTNMITKSTTKRIIRGYTQEPKHDYKAVVYMYLPGGLDSFNVLVPKANCPSKDMYQEYKKARGSHAISSDALLDIHTDSSQVCGTFGLHEKLTAVKDLYEAGDAAFFANMGFLPKPLNKHLSWGGQSKPVQLFAHNTMHQHAMKVDYKSIKAGSGVGGRMLDMLRANGYQTSPSTVNGLSLMNIGDTYYSNPSWTISNGGGDKFVDMYSSLPGLEMLHKISGMNGHSLEGNSVYGETWSSSVAQALFEYQQQLELDKAMENGAFSMDSYKNCAGLCGQLRAVAGYIKGRALRKVDREFFYVQDEVSYDAHKGGFDHASKMKDINAAIRPFVDEMKRQNLWNQVLLVQGSEFGRSITPNSSGGTDHAWGGNYFVLGGSLKANKIHGVYPEHLSDKSDYWVMNGRFIPTTSWDSLWNAVGLWMGLKGDDALDHTLPNRMNFDKCSLWSDHDIFENGVSSWKCDENDADGDGVVDGADQCPNSGWFQVADEFGCTSPTLEPTPAPFAPTAKPTNRPTLPPHSLYDTEDTSVCAFDGSSKISDGNPGFLGDGYTNMGDRGSWIEFFNIPSVGGDCTFSYRYANGGTADRPCDVTINGVPHGSLPFSPTQGWYDWQYESISANCNAGMNTIRIKSTTKQGGANIDSLSVSEDPTLAPPTPPPTAKPTPLPTVSPTSSPTTASPTNVPQPTTKPTPLPTPQPIAGRYEAEHSTQMGGSSIRLNEDGYYRGNEGDGYVDMGGDGSYIEWSGVDGGVGGPCSVELRYSLGKDDIRECSVSVNGLMAGTLTFETTGSWSTWGFVNLDANCNPGATNVIRLTALVTGGPNVDYLHVDAAKDPTPLPTRSPTTLPTPPPTLAPAPHPTTLNPTAEPSSSPTNKPTTSHPTINYESGTSTANILDTESSVSPFGCSNTPHNALDGTTEKWSCNRSGQVVASGFEVKPSHGLMTVVKKLRVYSHNNCPNCDPVTYSIEGRADASSPWILISSDDLPWKDLALDRNDRGKPISSSFDSGDERRAFTEVAFGNGVAYAEYRLTFPQTRLASSESLQFSEIELPGLLVDGSYVPPPPSPPTQSPTETTGQPTSAPTRGLDTFEPTSASPTVAVVQTAAPITSSGHIPVFSVVSTSEATAFGCDGAQSIHKSIDGTTSKMICNKMAGSDPGLIFTGTQDLSIVEGIRVYSHNNCPNCDPVKYKIEGRADSSSPWTFISEGDFDWLVERLPRNDAGLPIESTYSSGDTRRSFTEAVTFSNTAAFVEYKVTFTQTRGVDSTLLQLGEIELPGQIVTSQPPPVTTAPVAVTSAPQPASTSQPTTTATTLAPIASPTPRPQSSTPTLPPASTSQPTPPSAEGIEVANVMDSGSTITPFGCTFSNPQNFFDGTTSKTYGCNGLTAESQPGIIVTPSHGDLSIVEGIRVYAHNNCPHCDAVKYKLEGRIASSSSWTFIHEGDFDWIGLGTRANNDVGKPIDSTYSSGDTRRVFTEAVAFSNTAAFVEYKVTFTERRGIDHDTLQLGELELPGKILTSSTS